MQMDFDRVEMLANGMSSSGMQRDEAVAVSLAMEFAIHSKEFGSRFGEFTQESLERALKKLSTQTPG
jgi:hypothetical protein